MIIDKDILWAGSVFSPGQGLIRYNISNDKSFVYRKDDNQVELWGNSITALAINNNNNILWIGSWDYEGDENKTGLSWFDYDNNNWGRIDPSEIPELKDELESGDPIVSMVIDKENNLWAVLDQNGIKYIIVYELTMERTIEWFSL